MPWAPILISSRSHFHFNKMKETDVNAEKFAKLQAQMCGGGKEKPPERGGGLQKTTADDEKNFSS